MGLFRSQSVQYDGRTGVRVSAGELSVLHGLMNLAGCHSVTVTAIFSNCPINYVELKLHSPHASHIAHRTLKQHNRAAVAHSGVLQRAELVT